MSSAPVNLLPRPHRNQLVWLDDHVWRELHDGEPDAEARSVLAHWRARRLPLVVTCDRADAAAGQLSVGLPAPRRWSRRRLALSVAVERIQMTGSFPTLLRVARAMRWGVAATRLAQRLSACGAVARVYGSHGWQVLSGEPCTRAGSDVDLMVEVDGVGAARAALDVLQRARLHRRVDGEFAVPDGEAVAWREFGRACAGETRHVLLKSRSGARLVAFDEWSREHEIDAQHECSFSSRFHHPHPDPLPPAGEGALLCHASRVTRSVAEQLG